MHAHRLITSIALLVALVLAALAPVGAPHVVAHATPAWQPAGLAPTPAVDTAPADLSGAPRLAYLGADGNAWVVRADRTGQRRLTDAGQPVPSFSGPLDPPVSFPGYDLLGWSPQGGRLALAEGEKSASAGTYGVGTMMIRCEHLVILDADAGPVAATPLDQCPRYAVWEPDGSSLYLAFVQDASTGLKLNPATGAVEATDAPIPQQPAAWHHDSFERAQPCNHLRVSNPQTGESLELLSSCTLRVTGPQGTHEIAFPRQECESEELFGEARYPWSVWNIHCANSVSIGDDFGLAVNLESGASFGQHPGLLLRHFSPDGRYLLTATEANRLDSIQVLDLAALTLVQVAAGDMQSPRWEPGATMEGEIAYVHEDNLYLLDLATGTAQQLTSAGQDSDPAWSSDGRWLAFARSGDIYKLRVEGGEAKELIQVTHDPLDDLAPAFSSEGALFFMRITDPSSDPGDLAAYALIQATDSGEQTIYSSPPGGCLPRDLSAASSTRFALNIGCLPDNYDILLIEGQPARAQSLIERFGLTYPYFQGVAWAHSSGRLLSSGFSQSTGASLRALIELAPDEGNGQRNLLVLEQGYASDVDWSPDDSQVVFASDNSLWLVSAQGAAPRQISSVGSQPAWRPTAPEVVQPPPPAEVTPDSGESAPEMVTISGRVIEANDLPVSNVNIFDDAGHLVLTDSEGRFSIRKVKVGTLLRVMKGGYTFTPNTISVSAAGTSPQHYDIRATFPCDQAPYIKLDTCALQPGDILLERGSTEADVKINGLGSYFTHVAIYLGDQQVAEARPDSVDARAVAVRNIPARQGEWRASR